MIDILIIFGCTGVCIAGGLGIAVVVCAKVADPWWLIAWELKLKDMKRKLKDDQS